MNHLAPAPRMGSDPAMPSPPDRRQFIGTVSLAGLGSLAAHPASAHALAASAQPQGDGAEARTGVTRALARYVVQARYAEVPPAVRKEAQRTLLNWMGCAVGGSRHETLDAAIDALAPFSGPPQASVLGRRVRLDVLHASLMNGISSHVFDFDDTHLKTVIHPAGPVVSGLLALAEFRPMSGADFLHAMILGIEAECRIGNAVYPAHYDRGWHITGTAGVFGAAAACGKALGLTEQQMVWALGIAATQPVGLREMFGSMTKSFHPGRAAQNGLTAALLAARNFTSTEVGLEGKSGWANVLSTTRDYTEITGNFGTTWEIALNTYKPFACGIVIHPAIDACIQLRNAHKLVAADIERIDLGVHPLVLELTGKKTPQTGLETKFSVFFAAALAIVRGSAGMRDFSDANALDPVIVALRDRVTATIDRSVQEHQVRARITLKDGRVLSHFVEHVVGSLERPLSDAALEAKALDLMQGVLPDAQARALLGLCWTVEGLPCHECESASGRSHAALMVEVHTAGHG
jgi:2-methylcitrate dehydratase PrpD